MIPAGLLCGYLSCCFSWDLESSPHACHPFSPCRRILEGTPGCAPLGRFCPQPPEPSKQGPCRWVRCLCSASRALGSWKTSPSRANPLPSPLDPGPAAQEVPSRCHHVPVSVSFPPFDPLSLQQLKLPVPFPAHASSAEGCDPPRGWCNPPRPSLPLPSCTSLPALQSIPKRCHAWARSPSPSSATNPSLQPGHLQQLPL